MQIIGIFTFFALFLYSRHTAKWSRIVPPCAGTWRNLGAGISIGGAGIRRSGARTCRGGAGIPRPGHPPRRIPAPPLRIPALPLHIPAPGLHVFAPWWHQIPAPRGRYSRTLCSLSRVKWYSKKRNKNETNFHILRAFITKIMCFSPYGMGWQMFFARCSAVVNEKILFSSTLDLVLFSHKGGCGQTLQ